MNKSENSNASKQEKQDRINRSNFYHIEIRSQREFKRFRRVSVCEKVSKVKGQREDYTWEIIKWLVSTDAAHIENGKLVADHKKVQELFDQLNSVPIQIEGNRFAI